jgi:hypothetical protein
MKGLCPKFPTVGAPFDVLRELWAAPSGIPINPNTYEGLSDLSRPAIRMAILRLRRKGWRVLTQPISSLSDKTVEKVLGGIPPATKASLKVVHLDARQKREVVDYLRSDRAKKREIDQGRAIGVRVARRT